MRQYLSDEEVGLVSSNKIYKKNNCGGNIVFIKRIIGRNKSNRIVEFYRHDNKWNTNTFSDEGAVQLKIEDEIVLLNSKYIQKSHNIHDRDSYMNLYENYEDADALDYYFKDSPEYIRIQYVLKNISHGDMVYDAACNSGGIGKILMTEKNCKVYGSELCEKLANKAMAKGLNIYCGFAEDIPFEKNYFDTVVLSFILEHVLDPEYFMKVSVSVLKKGGKVIGCVPTEFGDWGEHTIKYHPEHLRAYNKLKLKELFEKMNLKNIEIEESYLKNRSIADYYLFSAEK